VRGGGGLLRPSLDALPAQGSLRKNGGTLSFSMQADTYSSAVGLELCLLIRDLSLLVIPDSI